MRRSTSEVSRLSPRETQILDLVAGGRTTKEIGAELGIAESTVNWHLANAFRKLGAPSRAAAVATALRAGLLASASRMPRASLALVPLRVRRTSVLRALWRACALAALVVAAGQVVVASEAMWRAAIQLVPAPRSAAPESARPTATAPGLVTSPPATPEPGAAATPASSSPAGAATASPTTAPGFPTGSAATAAPAVPVPSLSPIPQATPIPSPAVTIPPAITPTPLPSLEATPLPSNPLPSAPPPSTQLPSTPLPSIAVSTLSPAPLPLPTVSPPALPTPPSLP